MDMKTVVADKPHVVCIPFPAQSHIKAMLKFSKLLRHRGFHVTFVNTEFNHQRFLKTYGPNSLDGLSDFQFKTIPDSLPPMDPDATQDLHSLCDSIMKNLLAPFSHLLSKLNNATSNIPPVTCIISDGFMPFTVTAAQELKVPIVMCFSMAACSVMSYMCFPALKDKGVIPLKDESYLTNGYLDTVIDWIPGMRDICLKDLPSNLRTIDPNDIILNLLIETAKRALEASKVIVQTFNVLEQEVLDALSTMFSHVYAIGPLQPLLNQLPNDPLESIGYSLWKEETHCLNWLNSKAPNSVLYVNFDQQTTCKYTCNEWGIGMEINNDVKREEVEKNVRELMEGDKGKKMKKKALEWKKLAEDATDPLGSSSINLNNLVSEVLLSKGQMF
nr:7-deoxyloganetin glucosyltransferase [Quercus suber]